jgi:deoxycytidine triphosphate deaminase
MPMTDTEIKQAIKEEGLKIENMAEECLEPASYDLRIGSPLIKGGESAQIYLEERGSIIIRAGEFFTFRTHEKLQLTTSYSGHLGPKSYFIQRGLILLAGQHVDPGFKGYLLMGAYNASPRDIVVKYLDKICNIEFHKLAKPASTGAREFPELQSGDIPRDIRDYFMGIEPLTLGRLSEAMATLANNVSSMSKEVGTLSKIMWRFIVPLLSATFVAIIAAIIANFLMK